MSRERVKAEAKQKATEQKQSIDLSAIQKKATQKAEQREAEKQKKAEQKQKKATEQKAEKQTATEQKQSRKQTELAEYRQKLQSRDTKAVKELYDKLNVNNFHAELRDTTNCILFVRDSNSNTVFNVYDMFRIQFTTAQVAKYRDALLADSRFYTHLYKNKVFISAKSQSKADFFNLCEYCYKVVTAEAEKQKQTATEQKQTAEATA